MIAGPAVIGLFEGYGGLTSAVLAVLGGQLVAYSEIEPAACQLLATHHPDVPNLGDITAIDWSSVPRRPGRPLVLAGGFPCTDVSLAGLGLGIRPGTRSGLWTEMARAINALRPDLVVIENVRGLLSVDAHCDLEPCPWCLGDDEGRPLRALGAVLGDLASLGYVGRWHGLRAAEVGAPHGRFRVFIAAWPVADAEGVGLMRPGSTRRWRPGPADDGASAADASGRGQGADIGDVPAGQSDAAGGTAADALRDGCEGRPGRDVGAPGGQPAPRRGDAARRVLGNPGLAWGDYEPAIRRWELILGRPAPAPTQTGRKGGQQLSPRFVEWLMGLPEGHVTAVPGISRNEQLKMLGNGVVPAQAEAALRWLLANDAMAGAA